MGVWGLAPIAGKKDVKNTSQAQNDGLMVSIPKEKKKL